MIGYVDKIITEADVWSDAIEIQDFFNISVVLSDVKCATVTLQRSFDNGVIWKDYKTYTVSTEAWLDGTERKALYRIGVKAEQHAGQGTTATVRISF